MKQACGELPFSDQDQGAKLARDPVAPAARSAKALKKVHARTLYDGTQTYGFHTLLMDFSTIARNTCHHKGRGPGEVRFTITTTANAKQKRALELIDTIVM